MKRILRGLSFAVFALPASAAEWFPAEPGIGETQYVIYSDFCRENPPVGRPMLSVTKSVAGEWSLEIRQSIDTLCFSTPPLRVVARVCVRDAADY